MRNSKRNINSLVALLLVLPSCTSTRTPPSAHDLQLMVTAKWQQSEPVLHVQIVNRSDASVKLHAESLPWLGLTAMSLTAVEDDVSATPLPHAIHAWHPGPETFVVMPGSSIDGYVRLSDHFATLKETLARTPVVVYWNMTVTPIDGPNSERFFGGVAINAAVQK